MTIGMNEAKALLPRLIRKIQGGESVMITRHGKPVARIVPATDTGKSSQRAGEEIVAGFRKLRRSVKRGEPSIRALIDEGRRR